MDYVSVCVRRERYDCECDLIDATATLPVCYNYLEIVYTTYLDGNGEFITDSIFRSKSDHSVSSETSNRRSKIQ
jgi:hypothetical protein